MNNRILVILGYIVINVSSIISSEIKGPIADDTWKNLFGRFFFGRFSYVSEIRVGPPIAAVSKMPLLNHYFTLDPRSYVFGDTHYTNVPNDGCNYILFSTFCSKYSDEKLQELQEPDITDENIKNFLKYDATTEEIQQYRQKYIVSPSENVKRCREIMSIRGTWYMNYGQVTLLSILGLCAYKGVGCLLFDMIKEFPSRAIERFA